MTLHPTSGSDSIDRLTDSLPYFGKQAVPMENRADSTSRSLPQELMIVETPPNYREDP